MSIKFLICCLLFFCCLVLASAQQHKHSNDSTYHTVQHIVLQGFDWTSISNRATHWTRINNEVARIRAAGFTAVWLPPCSQSVDAEGYLIQRWYTLVGENELRKLITNLNSNGIVPIADVVLNHRTAPNTGCSSQYIEFEDPQMGAWAVVSNDVKCEGGLFCNSGCGCGAADTGANICYAPDLDHTNAQVQSLSKAFVSWLRTNLGFRGTRWDVATGFAPRYFGDYIVASGAEFSIGEYWDGNAQNVINWIDGTGGRSSAFDFPARYALQSAIKANSFGGLNPLPGVLRYWAEKSVTFLDNHDTVHSNDPFGNAVQIVQGYAYILTHPGNPCVFWNDYLTHYTAISTMIALRKEIGIVANTQVSISAATGGLYAAYVNSGKLAVKIGTNSWTPSGNYRLRFSGTNWAIWTL